MPPRHVWVPPAARSLGRDCVDWWRDAGGELFVWQEGVIEGILGLDDEDRWASTNDGLDVARQNGKGVILQAVEGFAAFELDYSVVMHTAHEFATALDHQLRLEQVIQDAPHLHARVKDSGGYVHANGKESINLKSRFQMSPGSKRPGRRVAPARIIFKARTKGGARGYSGDLLVWDEAMIIPPSVVGAQKPMTRASQAKHGPKTIYAGSAVDQEVHEYGMAFALIRSRGLERAPRVSWHEWSAPYDHPSEMTREVMLDRSWWPLANPSMAEGLITEETMADEIDTMPARQAAVELGGVGDWPDIVGAVASAVDLGKWDGLVVPTRTKVEDFVFTFDVSPDRSRSAIAMVGKRKGRGEHVVELVAHGQGTGWVVPWLRDGVLKHRPLGVACDSAGQAPSLVPELERSKIDVRLLNSAEFASGCGLFFDGVEEGTLQHFGQEELREAIRSATTKALDKRFKWVPIAGGDITPMVAVSAGMIAWWLFQGGTKHPTMPLVSHG